MLQRQCQSRGATAGTPPLSISRNAAGPRRRPALYLPPLPPRQPPTISCSVFNLGCVTRSVALPSWGEERARPSLLTNVEPLPRHWASWALYIYRRLSPHVSWIQIPNCPAHSLTDASFNLTGFCSQTHLSTQSQENMTSVMESRCEHTVKVSRKEQAECRLEGHRVLGVPQATSRWMTHEGDSQESGHSGALGCAVTCQSTKGRGTWGDTQGRPGVSLQGAAPRGTTQDSVPPWMSCDNMGEVLSSRHTHQRLRTQGWSRRHPPPGIDPEGEPVPSTNHPGCTKSAGAASCSNQFRKVGSPPPEI